MNPDTTRRNFVKLAGVGGFVSLTGCSTLPTQSTATVSRGTLVPEPSNPATATFRLRVDNPEALVNSAASPGDLLEIDGGSKQVSGAEITKIDENTVEIDLGEVIELDDNIWRIPQVNIKSNTQYLDGENITTVFNPTEYYRNSGIGEQALAKAKGGLTDALQDADIGDTGFDLGDIFKMSGILSDETNSPTQAPIAGIEFPTLHRHLNGKYSEFTRNTSPRWVEKDIPSALEGPIKYPYKVLAFTWGRKSTWNEYNDDTEPGSDIDYHPPTTSRFVNYNLGELPALTHRSGVALDAVHQLSSIKKLLVDLMEQFVTLSLKSVGADEKPVEAARDAYAATFSIIREIIRLRFPFIIAIHDYLDPGENVSATLIADILGQTSDTLLRAVSGLVSLVSFSKSVSKSKKVIEKNIKQILQWVNCQLEATVVEQFRDGENQNLMPSMGYLQDLQLIEHQAVVPALRAGSSRNPVSIQKRLKDLRYLLDTEAATIYSLLNGTIQGDKLVLSRDLLYSTAGLGASTYSGFEIESNLDKQLDSISNPNHQRLKQYEPLQHRNNQKTTAGIRFSNNSRLVRKYLQSESTPLEARKKVRDAVSQKIWTRLGFHHGDADACLESKKAKKKFTYHMFEILTMSDLILTCGEVQWDLLQLWENNVEGTHTILTAGDLPI